MVYEYWKTKLSGAERQFYEDLLCSFSSGRDSTPVRGLDQDQVRQVYSSLKNDHPELFFITSAPALGKSLFSGYSLIAKSTYSNAEISKREQVLRGAAAELKGRLLGAGDFEKELAIAEYIIDRTNYAVDNMRNQDASSVLYAGRAQCSGIAAAVKFLSDNLGLKCISVVGDAHTPVGNGAHTWNIIYIDGKPYHLDVTFMIGNNKRGEKPYRFTYFNLTDRQVSSTHSWDKSNLPECACDYVPPPSARAAGVNLTPVGAAYENSGNAKVLSSLYEFRREFLPELDKPHNEFVFLSKIKCDDDNELMKIISQACRQCFAQKKISYPISITISASIVTLSW